MTKRFRNPVLGVAGLVACSCSGPAPDTGGPAATDNEDSSAVIEAHQRFVRAIETSDTVGLTRLLDPSAELLVFHPRVDSRIDGIEEAARGFEKMLGRGASTDWTEVHAMVNRHGDVAWLTSHVVLESSALPEPFLGRGTEIWIRRTDGWKLVHGHWSPEPSGA